ncbi:Phosphatidylinositol transfer protein 2 [Smittium culicis]|uniref:Phosphatidylinositol transfer protein 2 n=1 Tax=Smittium culicis TaxID=133412 RepID=A0A1R1XWU3_9FUNG|nr:Phosphatidylinositol transfer protein 2 [Smittium culicis]
MKDKFKIITESMHLADRGDTENAVNLPSNELKIRKVEKINIADDSEYDSSKYLKEEDPKLFKSQKTGRGPLTDPNWRDICEPFMTCYKAVTVEFIWFGIQGKVEALIHKLMKQVMIQFHRRLFVETDDWFGMTMQDLRKMEAEAAIELEKKRLGENVPEKK